MTPRTPNNAPLLKDVVRNSRLDADLTVRELARRSGISHSQLSRLEAGHVARPSREVIVAIARGLNRNPNPLLIVAGHVTGDAARETLSTLFRDGSELTEVWSESFSIPIHRVNAIVRGTGGDADDVLAIAAEAFSVQESDETLWDDSYALATASGEGAEQLRELMDIWRYVGSDARSRWLEYGRQLRLIEDLEYLATTQVEQLKADTKIEVGR